MISKTLVKLVDYAIFPAVIVISAKVLGAIVFLNRFAVGYESNGLSIVFNNVEGFVAVNSYSSLIMFLSVLAGLGWVIVKAHIFHDTHVTPVLSSRLVELKLDELINDTKTIFAQSFVWLTYAWLTVAIMGVQAYYKMTYDWVFFISLTISVLATALLAYDIERELTHDEMDLGYKSSRGDNSVVRISSSEGIL